jgi:hypothetical protein
MRRTVLVVLVVVVVALGLLVSRVLRPSLESGRGQGQQTGESAPPTSAPNSAPTAVAAAKPGATTAPPTAPSRPTVAPTATAVSRDVVTELSESELQSQLTRMLVGKSLGTTPLGDATIQTVTVALRNRQVQVGGAAQTGFLNAPFTAAGTVLPDASGRPKVKVDEATVGGVGLPEGTRAALADMLQTEVDGIFADPSMKVKTIEIADGKMRVVSTPSP